MNGSFQIARFFGIPIVVNASWLLTLAFVTTMLALRFYPEVIPPRSPHRDDEALHWVMALGSGIVFFLSILLHELAHSMVARKQGIPVRSITLFIFGGVSQIGGEAKRPLHEFAMAIIGPLTSLAIAGVFFGAWSAMGRSEEKPFAIVVEWLFFMNLIVAGFNMAPGFPMDGGRVLRALLWGVSGNLHRATRLATLAGRALGYSLMFIGAFAFFGLLRWIDPWSGVWFIILGLFLESSARQSWYQARILDTLARYSAEEIMTPDLETAGREERLRYLANRGGRRFIFFVSDPDESVVGVLTEKEVAPVGDDERLTKSAGDVMLRPQDVPVAAPREDGASLLQRMEADAVWHLPVVSEGRVVGVVSKETLLRILARNLIPQPGLAG
ncbi:MAG TPA: site-2 protease family protein [Dehalococcoidia bacterium]